MGQQRDECPYLRRLVDVQDSSAKLQRQEGGTPVGELLARFLLQATTETPHAHSVHSGPISRVLWSRGLRSCILRCEDAGRENGRRTFFYSVPSVLSQLHHQDG